MEIAIVSTDPMSPPPPNTNPHTHTHPHNQTPATPPQKTQPRARVPGERVRIWVAHLVFCFSSVRAEFSLSHFVAGTTMCWQIHSMNHPLNLCSFFCFYFHQCILKPLQYLKKKPFFYILVHVLLNFFFQTLFCISKSDVLL